MSPLTGERRESVFLTRLLDQDVGLLVVQRLAEHASPTTTQLYDRRGEEAKKGAVDKLPNLL